MNGGVTSRTLRAVRQGVVGSPPTHPPLSIACEAGTRHPPWPASWSIHVKIACDAKSSA